jgi:hypothetical protein
MASGPVDAYGAHRRISDPGVIVGLFNKIKEMKMKDGVEGTLKVVGITMPDPTSTQCNYRLDGVVSAPGMEPTAIVHHGLTSVSHWPSSGQELPVTVDRANPEHIVIHWDRLKSSKSQARDMAKQLADQMRSGGLSAVTMPTAGGGAGNVSITVNGVPISLDGAIAAAGGAAAPAAEPVTVSNADILARGTPGNATLLGTFPVDVPSTKPDHINVGLMLNVMIDGHAPFQVQNGYAVPNDKVSLLVPNTLLPVAADMTTTGMVAINWDRVG